MCVIVHKPNNVDLNQDDLELCFKANNDMCGYMFHNGYCVVIKRGFSDFDQLMETWKHDISTCENNETVFHFRIATHGEIDVFNSHPFPITNDYRILYSYQMCSNYGIAHNGTITTLPFDFYFDQLLFEKYSDTFLYVSEVLNFVKNTQALLSILRLISIESYSKFVLMTNNKVHKIGTFHEVENMYFSNLLWKNKTLKLYSSNMEKYNYDYWKTYQNGYKTGFYYNEPEIDEPEIVETGICSICQVSFPLDELLLVEEHIYNYQEMNICIDCYEYIFG